MSARAKWREHVQAWRASGESAKVYCARAGINARTLSWWAWKFKKSEPRTSPSAHTPSATPFVELPPLALSASSSAFELEFGSILVRVPADFERDALARLLDTLEARPR